VRELGSWAGETGMPEDVPAGITTLAHLAGNSPRATRLVCPLFGSREIEGILGYP
jgi:hypothetical protein